MSQRILTLLAGACLLATAQAAPAGEITDMTGRSVTVPDEIGRVITLGSVPVINSFVFTAGKADTVVSGLPQRFVDAGRWTYQYVFAPQLADAPDLQDANYAPDIERILQAKPDVALSFETDTAEILEANGVPTVLLRIQKPEDVKAGVALVGEVLGNPEIGEKYAAFFDATLARVEEKVTAIPPEERPRVLYINPANMTQPHLVAEWWITAAGGDSVTDDGRTQEVLSLSTEVVVGADPDVIILGDPKHLDALTSDATLSQLRAVQEGAILVTPIGAHIWGNRTVEQPLTVLWAATRLHPDVFPEAELIEEVRNFYATFFRIELTDEQIARMLSGTM
ncbi:ABC transporter substrate-binding protein [Amaricoccus sp.]|uniref:ABC transporter substrate-binding protein n=1 Tax=Amaricoccus sp. TaxID=1872485 RepID=UPI001B422AEC|nr:ABC transporter substrate-binding protein [Amaricoccus sp.]MBP7002774.1 ABC transporter substrate-binding protein [Amaricoccus sp.]